MGTVAATRVASARIPEVLLALESLPPFPTVAIQAMNVLSGTDSSLNELCSLVRCDPVFTAEILRIANSPLIAFSKEVTSILQASMLLGFRRLRRLVITVGLRAYVEKSCAPALRACWRHSVACAMVAERTARWNSVDRDFAYTAGILHDIGRVALAKISPAGYSALFDRATIEPFWDALQQERETFGIDHCAAGRLLIETWKLPDAFLDTTCRHHDPQTHQEDAVEIIRLSCRLVDALGFGAIPTRSIPGCDKIFAEFPDGIRKHLPSAEDLAAEIAKEIGVIEAA